MLKNIFIAVITVLVLGVLGISLMFDTIAQRVFDRTVEANIGVDIRDDLQDGLHVLLCGTGSPMPDLTRAGPCTAVIAGDRAFIFDTGAGSARKLGRMRFPIGSVEAIYITHLHSDHVDGLNEAMLQSWIGGSRKSPTPLFGPVGIKQVAAGFNDAYRIDSEYRFAHHGDEVADLNGFGVVAEDIVLEGETNVTLEDGDLRIVAFRVSHHPIDPAFGYRVDYKGRSVTISGDTTYDANLVSVAKNTDVLVHEALNMEMVQSMERAAEAKGLTSIGKVFFDIQDYHTSPVDAARAASDSDSKSLVFTHIVPPLPTPMLNGLFVKGVSDVYSGPTTVGSDGLMISLPAGTDDILQKNLL